VTGLKKGFIINVGEIKAEWNLDTSVSDDYTKSGNFPSYLTARNQNLDEVCKNTQITGRSSFTHDIHAHAHYLD
jgi:hypothetical protein